MRHLTCRGHVLRSFDGLETHEWDLHWAEETDDEESVVGDVDPLGVAVHQQQNKDVEGDQVDDKDVASPCRHLKKEHMPNSSLELPRHI